MINIVDRRLIIIFFNIVDRRYIIIFWLILLRFVSFYFVYLFYFSFVEDILKQYLKDKNYHYHFPFSLINSSFEIKKKKMVVMCSSPP